MRRAVPLPAFPLTAVALTVGLWAMPSVAAGEVTASFSVSPRNPLSLTQVTFTSTSTATGEGNEIAWQMWDLDGDGAFDGPEGTTASRSFPRPGTYQVGLRVLDTTGGSSEAVETVRVGNRRPIASIAHFPDRPLTGNPLTLFSTSIDQDGLIASQAWDLDGDGQFDDSTKALATHVFGVAGFYAVRLRVRDELGAIHETALALTVTDPGASALSQGRIASPMLSPFPIVRVTGAVRRRGTRIRLFNIQAPPEAQVHVTCKGRGCPFRRRTRSASTGPRATASLRFRQFSGRVLRPGARVRVFVTSRTSIGKYTRFRFRKSRPPARVDRCLAPGTRIPILCPTGG